MSDHGQVTPGTPEHSAAPEPHCAEPHCTMPEATESSTLQAGLASEPPLTSLPTGAHDAAKPPQPPADAGRRWSSRAPKTIARFVAEAAPPPSLLRTIVEREGVVPSDVSTSLKSSLKQPQGGAQRKPRGAPLPEPSQRDPAPHTQRRPFHHCSNRRGRRHRHPPLPERVRLHDHKVEGHGRPRARLPPARRCTHASRTRPGRRRARRRRRGA